MAPPAASWNKPAPGTPYFTPAQVPPAGTAHDPSSETRLIPKLFQPLKIRGMTMQNRIMLSPLDQYSSDNGHATDWHMAHIGGIVKRGPGLSWVEATAVLPEGRVTPEDAGLWTDSQIAPLRRITDFAHGQGQMIGIQLAHAGRKASTIPPWLSASEVATVEQGGWPDSLWAPSAIPYADHPTPHAMTLADIQTLKTAFAAATKRSLAANFDTVEIHSAHGYLLHEFLSPMSNKRTDIYGGSLANRARLLLEIVAIVRGIVPSTMPVFVRVSGTDWLGVQSGEVDRARAWDGGQTAKLACWLSDAGVDVLDVSSGGLHPQQKVEGGPAYQSRFARQVKRELLAKGKGMLVSTVGAITSARLANDMLEGNWRPEVMRSDELGLLVPPLDIVAVGRGFQKNPGLVWQFGEELGLGFDEVNLAGNQLRWGFKGRGAKRYPTGKL